MNNPTGDLPQLPSNLREKLDRLTHLVEELRRDLTGVQMDPVDDTRLPWKKPINQDNIGEIMSPASQANQR